MIVMMGRTTDCSVALNHPKSGPARTAGQVHPLVRSQPRRQPSAASRSGRYAAGLLRTHSAKKLPRAGRT
jgi:hypothetical protein